MVLPEHIVPPPEPPGITNATPDEMVALTDLAFPGFFRLRTCEMGNYHGPPKPCRPIDRYGWRAPDPPRLPRNQRRLHPHRPPRQRVRGNPGLAPGPRPPSQKPNLLAPRSRHKQKRHRLIPPPRLRIGPHHNPPPNLNPHKTNGAATIGIKMSSGCGARPTPAASRLISTLAPCPMSLTPNQWLRCILDGAVSAKPRRNLTVTAYRAVSTNSITLTHVQFIAMWDRRFCPSPAAARTQHSTEPRPQGASKPHSRT
jgi:hypothetical protein